MESPEAGNSTPNSSRSEIAFTGDARALGFAAFATTTFLFGLSFTTIWSRQPSVVAAIAVAVAFGGAIQVLAGIWAFARHQAFPAVAFCSFGAFYLSYYLFVHTITIGLSSGDLATATSVFFLAWLILSTYVFLAALRVSAATAVTYFFWWLTYLLLVIGGFLGNADVIIGGGAAGVATAGFAWYASCALLVNETAGRKVLRP